MSQLFMLHFGALEWDADTVDADLYLDDHDPFWFVCGRINRAEIGQ